MKYKNIQTNSKQYCFIDVVFGKECVFLLAETKANKRVLNDKGRVERYTEDVVIYTYRPFSDDTKGKWNKQAYKGLDKDFKGVALPSKDLAFCGVSLYGNVVSLRDEEQQNFTLTENAITNLIEYEAVYDISVIDDEIYISCGGSQVFKYIADDNWEELELFDKESDFGKRLINRWFKGIAGFSRDEIYTINNKGILWFYDKGQWQHYELPEGKYEHFVKITCGTDDRVYILSKTKLFIGKHKNWETLTIGERPYDLVESMAWFKGKLYLWGYFGLCTLKDDKRLEKVRLDKDKNYPRKGFHTLRANDDYLILIGDDAVLLFNGKHWSVLFDKNQTEEELREQGIFYDPRKK